MNLRSILRLLKRVNRSLVWFMRPPSKHSISPLNATKRCLPILTHTARRLPSTIYNSNPYQPEKTPQNGPAIIASKSHMTEATQNFIARYNVSDQISAGSSLKFCLLAMGDADIYPRFGPTMEWDTAAGHAVLNAAGGVVLMEDGSAFTYGHADRGFLNPFFIAWGDREFAFS